MKRYDIYMHSDDIQFLRECPDGDYCKVVDVDATILELRAQVERMERDTLRLDWLEAMGKKPGGLLLHSEENTGRLGLGLANTGRTLRQAVDDAGDLS